MWQFLQFIVQNVVEDYTLDKDIMYKWWPDQQIEHQPWTSIAQVGMTISMNDKIKNFSILQEILLVTSY